MKTRDEVIGSTCKTCGVSADVVATWQKPPSKGHPLGSLEHVPYCAVHALAVMNGPTPPPIDRGPRRRRATPPGRRTRRAASTPRRAGARPGTARRMVTSP